MVEVIESPVEVVPEVVSADVPVAENASVTAKAETPPADRALAPFPEELRINDLQELSPAGLQALADSVGWRVNASRTKHQLIYDLMAWIGGHKTRLLVDGILDIGPEGFGLIRYPKYSFAPLTEDIFVPSFIVRKFGLRPGQRVGGIVKAPKDKEKYAAIDRITEVEGLPVEQFEQPTPFDKLTALFPSERIILETPKSPSVSARVVDLVAPLGKGQRALIMASPRSGKTILLKEIAKSITINHPEIALIVLLLDERPEEVTDFEESVSGCEIYSSTFDESPKRHTQVAELVSERAKRLVEEKKHVVILLDSITRLARGYNAMQGGKGRTMSGGMDAKALMKPKKFFGAARNVEEGGSLSIIATALVETESKMDDLIFEEFKGTGNMEIALDRKLMEKRIFPCMDINKSGTRKEELLTPMDQLQRLWILRKVMAPMNTVDSMEFMLDKLTKAKTNAEFIANMNS